MAIPRGDWLGVVPWGVEPTADACVLKKLLPETNCGQVVTRGRVMNGFVDHTAFASVRCGDHWREQYAGRIHRVKKKRQ